MKRLAIVLLSAVILLGAGGSIALPSYFNSNQIEVVDILAERLQGVVLVRNTTKAPKSVLNPKGIDVAIGAGFFIDENLIITNYHVIDEATAPLTIAMKENLRQYETEIVSFNKTADVALLRIKDWDTFKSENDYRVLKFANSRNAKLGASAYAIGHPWGLKWSISTGTIAGFHRKDELGGPIYYIQTDAKVYQGNSGGPLLNANGDVLGMNSIMISEEGGSYGMALPAELVQRVVSVLRNSIGETKLSIFNAESIKLKRVDSYLNVFELADTSYLFKSGLRVGDKLIRFETSHTNGELKLNNVERYIDEMSLVNPGETAKIIVFRDNKEVTILLKDIPESEFVKL